MSSKEIEVDLVFEYIPRLTNWNKKKHLLYFFFYFFIIVFTLTLCIGNPQFSTSETVTKTFDPQVPVNEFILKGVNRNNQYLEGETQYHNKADFGVIANVGLHLKIYGSNQEDINNNTKWNEIKTYSLNRSVVSTGLETSETIASLSLPFVHYRNYKVQLLSYFESGSQFFDSVNFKFTYATKTLLAYQLSFRGSVIVILCLALFFYTRMMKGIDFSQLKFNQRIICYLLIVCLLMDNPLFALEHLVDSSFLRFLDRILFAFFFVFLWGWWLFTIDVYLKNIRDPDTKKQFIFKRILPKLIPLLCLFYCLIYDSYIYSHYHTLDKELNGIESVTGYQSNRYILFISFLICLLWIIFQYIEIYMNLKKIDQMKNIILNYTTLALIPVALSIFIISDFYSPNPSNVKMILILQPIVYNCYFIFLSFAWLPEKSEIGDQDPKIIQSDGDYDEGYDDGDDDDVEFNKNYNGDNNSINEEDFNSDINSSNRKTNRNERNDNNNSSQNLSNNNKSARKKYLDREKENGELSNENNSVFDEFDIDPHPFESSSDDYSNNKEELKMGKPNDEIRKKKRSKDGNSQDNSRVSINKEYEFVTTNSENELENKIPNDSNTKNGDQIVKNNPKIQKAHSNSESEFESEPEPETLDISPDESYEEQKNGNQNNSSQFETYNNQQQQEEEEEEEEEEVEFNYTSSEEDSEVMLSIFASNINHQNENPLSTLEQRELFEKNYHLDNEQNNINSTENEQKPSLNEIENKSNDKNNDEKIEEEEEEEEEEGEQDEDKQIEEQEEDEEEDEEEEEEEEEEKIEEEKESDKKEEKVVENEKDKEEEKENNNEDEDEDKNEN
ncbi:transmembrane protein [Anaeramoeba flamelloides]|uniref:Transmembrane protein n=1 Tax=Anaeramoeba flamelloides TaxID=1746091 RepID=A0ABQ8Z270_9EUKA|nr:transmembrane protein [Anaeramoeba flamelloides]